MGFFDKFKSSSNSEPERNIYIPKSEQEAFIAIMYSCLMIDGQNSDAENDMLARIGVMKSFFREYDYIEGLARPAINAYNKFGSKTVIDYCVSKIAEENKPSLLCFVIDIAMADGILADNEKNIIEYLISKLEMSDDLASKIIEVMMYKNKWNVLISD